MYQLTIQNPITQQQTILSLPLTYFDLEIKLKSIGITNIDDPITIVNFTNDDNDLPQLPIKMLDHADIFQINFLAQRIDSLTPEKQEDMNTVIEAFNIHKISDLINLTYEVEHDTYKIIENVNDHDDLGKWFTAENCYDLPSIVLDNIDYSGIGYDLDHYDYEGKFCDRGYVFIENPMDEKVYDGIHFPDFAYGAKCIANIKYVNDDNGLISYLKLPAGDFAMQRVLKELECGSFNGCRIDPKSSIIFDQYDFLSEKDDIEKLNNLCKDLALLKEKDFVKLQAIVAYAKVSEEEMFYRLGAKDDTAFEKLNALYRHLNDFDFFPNIHSPEAYADHLVNEMKMFDIGEELTPYIRYAELGRDWIDGEGGRFVPGGYVVDETPVEREAENNIEEELEI